MRQKHNVDCGVVDAKARARIQLIDHFEMLRLGYWDDDSESHAYLESKCKPKAMSMRRNNRHDPAIYAPISSPAVSTLRINQLPALLIPSA